MRPAIFLDRDGVVIENLSDYVRRWEQVEIYPQAITALVRLAQSTFAIVLVTNQSAIGRGIITKEQAHSINTRLTEAIVQAGGRIDGVFMCPHKPDDKCMCRKPNPGLLQQAVEALSIDLTHSIMVGDAYTDLLAGQRAGVAKIAMVRTGRGSDQEKMPGPSELREYQVFDTLTEALEKLLPSAQTVV